MEDRNITEHAKQCLDVAISAAKKAGKYVLSNYNKENIAQTKSAFSDLVTAVDKESENIIISHLKQHFPNDAIQAEESGEHLTPSAFKWLVDPLDGTTNFVHNYPMFAVSIGLLYQNSPIVGVIYNPVTNELFTAAKDAGAYLNGNPIKVSAVKTIDQSLLATGFSYDRAAISDNNYEEFCHLTSLSQGVRRGGAASLDLAYVACGRLDGYWEKGLQPWDIAAGSVLVSEAGGLVSDYDIKPIMWGTGRILASNGKIHTLMSEHLV